MKKRLGFVSNSSSSSFIIGIAKVKDRKKLEEKYSDILSCLDIRTIQSFVDEKWGGLYEQSDRYMHESFDGTEVTISKDNINKDDLVLVVDDYEDIYPEDDDWDIDYDKDYYHPYEDRIDELLSDDEVVEHGEFAKGAGYNG
jgi:hypothetical protein